MRRPSLFKWRATVSRLPESRSLRISPQWGCDVLVLTPEGDSISDDYDPNVKLRLRTGELAVLVGAAEQDLACVEIVTTWPGDGDDVIAVMRAGTFESTRAAVKVAKMKRARKSKKERLSA